MMDLQSYSSEKARLQRAISELINSIEEIKNIIKDVNLGEDFDKNIKDSLDRLYNDIDKLKDDKVKISVIAEVSNGKSTFINALLFRNKVLEARIGETTARLYFISYSDDITIRYGSNYKRLDSMDDLYSHIKTLNDNALKDIEGKKTIQTDYIDVYITIPNENLKYGIEIIDTPGFGSLNQDVMNTFISKAINMSDGVIVLLDISQGIKKTEYDSLLRCLQYIHPDKRYIVFNKIDAVEEESENFERVGKDTVEKLNTRKELTTRGKIDYDTQVFYVSAKKALNYYLNKTTDEKYKRILDNFENKFWQRIIDYKQKNFLEGIKIDSLSIYNSIRDSLINIIDSTNNSIQSLKKEYDKILINERELQRMADDIISFCYNMNKKLDDLSRSFIPKNIIDQLRKLIINRSGILSVIDSIGWMDNEEKIQEKINNAFQKVNIEKLLEEIIQKDFGSAFENLINDIKSLDDRIDEYNKKLDKLGIKQFRFKHLDPSKNENYSIRMTSLGINQIDSNIGASDIVSSTLSTIMKTVSIGGMLRVIGIDVVGMLAEAFGIERGLASTIIGIPLAVVSGIYAIIKKDNIRNKIEESIDNFLDDLKNELGKIYDNKLKPIKDYVYVRIQDVNTIASIITEYIHNKNLEENIEKLESDLKALNSALNIMKAFNISSFE